MTDQTLDLDAIEARMDNATRQWVGGSITRDFDALTAEVRNLRSALADSTTFVTSEEISMLRAAHKAAQDRGLGHTETLFAIRNAGLKAARMRAGLPDPVRPSGVAYVDHDGAKGDEVQS